MTPERPAPLTHITLASASPRRLELLRSVGFDVTVMPSRYEEVVRGLLAPAEIAMLHARNKLREVSNRTQAPVIVAADTVVDVDGRALGKPRDAEDARRMLHDLSSRTHAVHTAYALAVAHHAAPLERCITSRVTFFPLSSEEIDAYVQSGEPLDKAGAYGVQGCGAALVKRIDGDFYTVMGLPLGHFLRDIRALGFGLPKANGHPVSRQTD